MRNLAINIAAGILFMSIIALIIFGAVGPIFYMMLHKYHILYQVAYGVVYFGILMGIMYSLENKE
jgi:hypothetical protein